MIHLSCDERYEKLLGQHLDLTEQNTTLKAKCDKYEAALNMVGDFVHCYCVIIHPDKNKKGDTPETTILNIITQALANE